MKSDRISKLTLSNYRGFNGLEVNGLEQVNLITGSNNTGKSTLLEAIQLSATNGSLAAFQSILTNRGEYLSQTDGQPIQLDDVTPVCTFFHGYPSIIGCHHPFRIKSISNFNQAEELMVSIRPHAERLPNGGGVQYDLSDDDVASYYEQGLAPHLIVERSNGKARAIPLGEIQRKFIVRSSMSSEMRCIYLSLYSLRSSAFLATLWDSIVLTPLEADVLAAVKIISPDITAISPRQISGGQREIFAGHAQYDHPVPLKSLGDGVNRLFGIILALVYCKNGVLLVDELETGLHYSTLEKVWELIFKLAQELNVQVIATTHSSDCVQAFSEVANENPAEGALIKLQNLDGVIYQTQFDEEDLMVARKRNLELR